MRKSRCHEGGFGGLILLLMLAAASSARGQSLRDLVEEVLDQTAVNVQIDGQPIREALAQLGGKTGLRFSLGELAVAQMPYGERTRVSLSLSGLTLREGLRQMFDGLGLEMQVVSDIIHVNPAPVLERLGRRLTIDEVRTLQTLAGCRWAELENPAELLQFRGLPSAAPRQLELALARIREPNALRQLEVATATAGWSWRPHEKTIVVYAREEDIIDQLHRRVDLNYRDVPLDQVLLDLADRIGVTMLFEPGVLERIQAPGRKLDLVHQNTTVFQALERICGSTGTCFEVQPVGVLIASTEAREAPRRAGPARIIAIVTTPVGTGGTQIHFPIYEDECPPEIQQLRAEQLPVALELLRGPAER